MNNITAAVITISDRCSAGQAEDVSGPPAKAILEEAGYPVGVTYCVPDDVRAIAEAVQNAAYDDVDLVFTTGGTGISPQDYTARAMDPLFRFDIPGIPDAIRYLGIRKGTPEAMLSRGRAGIMVNGRGRTLVVNAPGSVGGVRDALEVLIPILPHAVSQMLGEDHEVRHDH